MPFYIVRQDITKMDTDAVVNAANPELVMGGGVCGAIFRAAGPEALEKACRPLGPIAVGSAVITPGFSLKAAIIIHAAGPVYRRQSPAESRALLCSAYRAALALAEKNRCRSIAFPLISAGIYGYPRAEALRAASDTIRDFLRTHDMAVYLAILDSASFEISPDTLENVRQYLAGHYGPDSALLMARACRPAPVSGELDRLMAHLDAPFNEFLLHLIDEKGLTDAQVYNRANIDRKLFSKIRIGRGYLPGKRTVLALAVALELNLEETDELLERAGYALSHSRKLDVIVEYFISSGSYDIFRINEVLFAYGQPLLGTGG